LRQPFDLRSLRVQGKDEQQHSLSGAWYELLFPKVSTTNSARGVLTAFFGIAWMRAHFNVAPFFCIGESN
jgi:hypothetical protein